MCVSIRRYSYETFTSQMLENGRLCKSDVSMWGKLLTDLMFSALNKKLKWVIINWHHDLFV